MLLPHYTSTLQREIRKVRLCHTRKQTGSVLNDRTKGTKALQPGRKSILCWKLHTPDVMNVFTLSSSSKEDQTVLPRVTAVLIQETDSKTKGWSGQGDTRLVWSPSRCSRCSGRWQPGPVWQIQGSAGLEQLFKTNGLTSYGQGTSLPAQQLSLGHVLELSGWRADGNMRTQDR